jgi:hypothetical protein
MPVNITSTTDTEEMIKAAISGDQTTESEDDKKESAQDDESSENKKASESSESDGEKESESEDESEESEGEESKEDQGEDEKPKPRRGFKKRIDKLTRRLSEREKEIEYWKGKAEGRNPSEAQAKPVREESKGDSKPRADDFDSHEEYVEALADWKVNQRLQEMEQNQKKSSAQTEYRRRVDTLQAKVKEFSEKHSDFAELVDEVGDIPMSPAVQELILDSENGPELMYELAKDPEEYQRICSLAPLAAARAMGKFESRIKIKTETSEKVTKRTRAPEPIKPVNSKNAASTKKSIFDESLSQRDYERMMEERADRRASSW